MTNRVAAITFPLRVSKAGWRVTDDVEGSLFSPELLEPIPFLKEGEDKISGDEVRRRATELNANLGYRQLEYIILAYGGQIPKEWKSYILFLPGTIWLVPDGEYYIQCLHWEEVPFCFGRSSWCAYFYPLSGSFDFRGRLLRRRK